MPVANGIFIAPAAGGQSAKPALDAVDLGLRTIVVSDAICSACDQTHDALLSLYARRFQQQVELADAGTVLGAWC